MTVKAAASSVSNSSLSSMLLFLVTSFTIVVWNTWVVEARMLQHAGESGSESTSNDGYYAQDASWHQYNYNYKPHSNPYSNIGHQDDDQAIKHKDVDKNNQDLNSSPHNNHHHHQNDHHPQEEQPSYFHHQEDGPYYLGKHGSSNHAHHHSNSHHHHHSHHHSHHNSHGNSCLLPESWKGKWFQSGIPSAVLIDSKSIEGKGTCYESSGDKFLFVEKSNCHRCVVINQRHHNVLEYKESPFCEERRPLAELCLDIPGDANLYSLFRLEATPIPCPFKGPYTFTYNKGTGLCRNPVSHIDTCTEPSRLLLRYQACPDIPKSESTVEELTCLGSWREGTYTFLVGKINHQLAVSNEDRYRCFIYEFVKGHTIAKIAVSGDATCSGLSSPIEGAKTMTFTKVNEGSSVSSSSSCKFPFWFSTHHWTSLDGKMSVKTSHRNSTMLVADISPQDQTMKNQNQLMMMMSSRSYNNNNNRGSLFSGGSRVTCHHLVKSEEEGDDHNDLGDEGGDQHVVIVAQHTEGCTSTPVCLHLYRRSSHVIELQITPSLEDYSGSPTSSNYGGGGCHYPPSTSNSDEEYVTLIRAETPITRCPYLGKYMMVTPTNSRDCPNFHSVVVGCGQRATMDFHHNQKCPSGGGTHNSQEPITSYECHGSWEGPSGSVFVIASPLSRSSTSARRYCFTYMENDEGLSFTSSSENCQRPQLQPTNSNLANSISPQINLTVDGQCAEPMTGGGGGGSFHHCPVLLSLSLVLSLPSHYFLPKIYFL